MLPPPGATVAKPPNPSQGLKRDIAQPALMQAEAVAKPPNPSQGLKLRI